MFVNTAGMNSAGLFSSCQQLHPVNIKPGRKTDANLYTFELFETISFCTSVTEVEEIARRLPLVDIPGITLHNLFADVKGRAIVTEAGTSATQITEQNKNFMVMTNFALHSIAGKHYKQAKGFGDDRYIICHEYLQQHAPNFSIDKGFTLLSMSRSKGASFSTICSMVFDPQKNEVYIAFKSDFSKIVKLSIENGNIETFQGYGQKKLLPAAVKSEGLLVKDLEKQLH